MKAAAVLLAALAALATMTEAAKIRGGNILNRQSPSTFEGLPTAQLEQTLLAVLAQNQKVTPGLQPLLDTIGKSVSDMENTVKTNLASTQKSIDAALEEFKKCSPAATEDYGRTTSAFASNHSQCRKAEATAREDWNAAGASKLAADTASTSTCKQFDDMKTLPTQCSAGCIATRTNLPVDQYLAAMQKYYGDQLNSYKALDQACSSSKQELATKTGAATVAETTYTTKLAECDRTQREMERKSCDLISTAQTNCDQYDKCYAAANDRYKKSEWDKALDGYKVEWASFQRLKCLVSSLGEQDDDARKRKLQECTTKDFSPEAQFLTLKIDPKPDKQTCAVPNVLPGSATYQSSYLAGLPATAPAKACSAQCCVATTAPTTTTARAGCLEAGGQDPPAQFSVIAGANWEVYPKYDCPFSDVDTLKVVRWDGSAQAVTDRRMCAQRCLDRGDCTSFVMDRNALCWLKSGPQKTSNPVRDCGAKQDRTDFYTLLNRKCA